MSDNLDLKILKLVPGEGPDLGIAFHAAVVEPDEVIIIDLRPDESDTVDRWPRAAMNTYEKVRAVFGFSLDRSRGWDATPVGSACYKVGAIYLRTGTASFIPKTLDANGQALQLSVIARWPGAPALPSIVNIRYYENGVVGRSNADGDVGFGFTGSSLVPGDGSPGPYSIWVDSDPANAQTATFYADCLNGLGWINVDHFTANPIFYRTVKTSGGGEPVPGEGRRIAIFDEAGNVWGIAPLQTGAVPAGKRTMRVLSDEGDLGFVVLS